jgi:hypothetical protein
MLKTILSVSGKPGLYKMVSQGKNFLIVESLTDKKRVPAHARDKVISLGDISIYASEADVPLHKVLTRIREKENGQNVSLDLPKATPDDLRAYMAEILPDFDRGRVYPTDIKRLLNWYNTLLSVGITDYDPKEEEKTEETEKEPEAETKEETKPATKTPKAAVPKKTAAPKQKAAAKQPAGKSTQRTRQK